MHKFIFEIEHVTGQGPTPPVFVEMNVYVKKLGIFKKKIARLDGTHDRPRGVFAQKPGTIAKITAHPADIASDWEGDWATSGGAVWLHRAFWPAEDYPELMRLFQAVKKSNELFGKKLDQRDADAKEVRGRAAQERGEVTYLRASAAGGPEALLKLARGKVLELYQDPTLEEDVRFVAKRPEKLPDELKKFIIPSGELKNATGGIYIPPEPIEPDQSEVDEDQHEERVEKQASAAPHDSYKDWADQLLATGEMPTEVPEAHKAVVLAIVEARVADIKNKLKKS